jgi:hypothetical protein
MRIVFALHHAGAFRSFEEVVRYWCHAGHSVHMLVGDLQKPTEVDRGLKACLAELDGFTVEGMHYRQKWLKLTNVRELLNFANYLRPEHPAPGQARRWKGFIAPVIRKLIKRKPITRLLPKPGFRRLLRRIESLIPPDRAIRDWLRTKQPDIVVASPYIFPLSGEVEYIKAARALGISTAVIVLSWDNLTSKGTFHVLPDVTLVWNSALADEAASLHDVPREKLVVTGAPTFDFWYVMKPSLDYAAFARKAGIDASKPFVLYLCSSHFIAENEHRYVAEFARALRDCPETREVDIVVRPHPLNDAIWKAFILDGVVIWPRSGEWVDLPDAKQNYYDTLYHSAAVVGVNTSAFLEAAILGKPGITVLTEASKPKQSGLGHFQHLLNGGFLEIAQSYQKAAAIFADILAGRDARQAQRQRFVRDFIRPRGIDQPVSTLMAKVIEGIAIGGSVEEAAAMLERAPRQKLPLRRNT